MYESSTSKFGFKRKPNEVQVARGRLKDALHTLVANSDDDSDYKEPTLKQSPRGRPKSVKIDTRDEDEGELPSQPMHESFVMKLFDRSLDLSKYDDRTGLYPICRAWMTNTPRSTAIRSFRDRRSPSPERRENNAGELLEKLRSGEINEITEMPAPMHTEMIRIPPILVEDDDEEGRNKAELALKGASKAQLLAAHKQRWKKVRQHWQSHTRRYQEEKFDLNFQIIEACHID